MDKTQQLQAIANVLNALNSLPITGAESDLLTGVKQLLNQVGSAMQKEVQEVSPPPLTQTSDPKTETETETSPKSPKDKQ